jgi:catechol 2,3-dioxygenase-like lactoylglutathione lyase family enzyme
MTSPILVTIPTRRMEESIAFYTGTLRFAVENRLQRPGGVELAFLVRDGFTVELVSGPRIPAGEVGSGAPLLTFMADDFSEIRSRLDGSGADEPEAADLPGGMSMLRFKDPNGVVISFVKGRI